MAIHHYVTVNTTVKCDLAYEVPDYVIHQAIAALKDAKTESATLAAQTLQRILKQKLKPSEFDVKELIEC